MKTAGKPRKSKASKRMERLEQQLESQRLERQAVRERQQRERQAVMDALFEMLLADSKLLSKLLPNVDFVRRDNDNVRINISLDDGGFTWTIDCALTE